MLHGAADVIGEFANPLKLEAVMLMTLTTYFVILCAPVPEPVTKGIAAVMTVTLYGYLGHELWGIVKAYSRMMAEADTATTFAEVHVAGDRFGTAIGQNATRILIMVATARLGTGIDKRVKRLPGFAAASKTSAFETPLLVGATAKGESLTLAGVLGNVNTAVLGKSHLNAVLGTGAVAMTASGPGGSSNSTGAAGSGDGNRSYSEKIKSRLKPNDRWIGDKGMSTDIRVLKGGLSEAEKLFDELAVGGTQVTGSSYPGTLVRFPDGATVGLRPASKSGPPTLDVSLPGLPIMKFKFLP